jgi:hypothetical protein
MTTLNHELVILYLIPILWSLLSTPLKSRWTIPLSADAIFTEVGNVTWKFNGVTHYRSCVLKTITFRSDNGSNFDRAVTLGCDNGSNELEAITFPHFSTKVLCDNANCIIALSLYRNARPRRLLTPFLSSWNNKKECGHLRTPLAMVRPVGCTLRILYCPCI